MALASGIKPQKAMITNAADLKRLLRFGYDLRLFGPFIRARFLGRTELSG
jgi:hypothetical protein